LCVSYYYYLLGAGGGATPYDAAKKAGQKEIMALLKPPGTYIHTYIQ
jgi:hypothetical protein